VDYEELYVDEVTEEDSMIADGTKLESTACSQSAGTSNPEDKMQCKIKPKLKLSPLESFRLCKNNPILSRTGIITFFFFTGLWGIISTLSIYATKQFQFPPSRLGLLLTSKGITSLIGESVLVRAATPYLGEKRSIKYGLIAFTVQCFMYAFAYKGWHLFLATLFSMISMLVYPSLTSVVSNAVPSTITGEALGAINGVKALTEGVGPFLFCLLMTLPRAIILPGWPYLVAALFGFIGYWNSLKLNE